ncbi:uncharacterized protein Z518_07565 [Rhinocladiella mackenziei CBS 650.93]|uniref:Transmembrane protein n=1 Tax=Rhinocladiella mackenziei CBS 650.93 TaxID=1442369 RepID=A0A0D2FPE8_9EURO|nr:uncharacterized protein Z518_07565 [Rhinocladiella mackenziei CBS 650.93]KIX04012.1 hypothetical protein Z518_07565 [Rhinocladiella mackenziei CBS 650.93]
MASSLSNILFNSLALLLCLNFLESLQVLAQTGDGGGAEGVEPGDIGSDPGYSENAGASGADTGSVNLSHGATIAIAVVVSIVVVLGITMTVLFYLAKKRQWKIKEGIRRSARRVTSAVKAVTTPLTPKKMTFSPVEKRKLAAESADLLKRANDQLKADAQKQPTGSGRSSNDRDLEKGLPETAVKVEIKSEPEKSPKRDSKNKQRPPKVNIPSSAFEIDSPKTPMWKKVFGR